MCYLHRLHAPVAKTEDVNETAESGVIRVMYLQFLCIGAGLHFASLYSQCVASQSQATSHTKFVLTGKSLAVV